MSKLPRLSLLVLFIGVIALGGLAPIAFARPAAMEEDGPPAEASVTANCQDGVQASGAKYRICMPLTWNKELLVYAHGYVRYDQPVAIPEDQLVLGGYSLPDVVTGLGTAFATTSYSTNGLAIKPGIADLVDLVNIFKAQYGQPAHVYLAGVSEGGLITTLAIEQYPDVFDGGLAACGPVGGLPLQTNYFGDFRVVFDYFFPGLMPGEPITIPQELIDDWDSYYANSIAPVITAPTSAYSLTQLMRAANAAYDPPTPASLITTTRGVLGYNVFATNDAKAKLGGSPFDNLNRYYTGTANDTRLNQLVRRFAASQAALDEMQAHYQPTGQLAVPLVTLHTTLDEIVPYAHENAYRALVVANHKTAWHDNIAVPRYGHCNFQVTEVLQAFALLVDRVMNPAPDLSTSRKSVTDADGDGIARAGEILTYTITLTNSGTWGAGLVLTDTLPDGLTYIPGSLTHNRPDIGFTASFSQNVLTAHTTGYLNPPTGGSLYLPDNVATITFAVQVSSPPPTIPIFVNAIALRDQKRDYTSIIPPAIIRAEGRAFVIKTADPISRTEPGGAFTFTLTISNPSIKVVTLQAISDTQPLSQECLDLVGAPIGAGQAATCQYSLTYTETGSYTNTVSITVKDSEGKETSYADAATVWVSDALPGVTLVKTASPPSRPEPGGAFTFTLTISNTSVEIVTLTAISDTQPLGPGCLDLVGAQIGAGQAAVCQYSVTYTAVGTYTNTASVTVEDNEGNSVTDADKAAVQVTHKPVSDFTAYVPLVLH